MTDILIMYKGEKKRRGGGEAMRERESNCWR